MVDVLTRVQLRRGLSGNDEMYIQPGSGWIGWLFISAAG